MFPWRLVPFILQPLCSLLHTIPLVVSPSPPPQVPYFLFQSFRCLLNAQYQEKTLTASLVHSPTADLISMSRLSSLIVLMAGTGQSHVSEVFQGFPICSWLLLLGVLFVLCSLFDFSLLVSRKQRSPHTDRLHFIV